VGEAIHPRATLVLAGVTGVLVALAAALFWSERTRPALRSRAWNSQIQMPRFRARERRGSHEDGAPRPRRAPSARV
jgi:hypothetical protein